MLKIKENIDLKELEKLGYKKECNWYTKTILKDIDEISIAIDEDSRLIQLAYSTKSKCCGYTYDLNCLYELFELGYIERVKGE